MAYIINGKSKARTSPMHLIYLQFKLIIYKKSIRFSTSMIALCKFINYATLHDVRIRDFFPDT